MCGDPCTDLFYSANQIVINTFEIIQNFVVGIMNDRNAASIQCGGSCGIIILRTGVGVTVNFYCEMKLGMV